MTYYVSAFGVCDSEEVARANPPDPDQIERARRFIVEFSRPRKSINTTDGSSYGLKHAAEEWHKEICRPDDDPYISNGAFITAAQRLGIGMKRTPDQRGVPSPNVWFALGWSPRTPFKVAVRERAMAIRRRYAMPSRSHRPAW